MFSDKKPRESETPGTGQNRINDGTKLKGNITSIGYFRIDGIIEGHDVLPNATPVRHNPIAPTEPSIGPECKCPTKKEKTKPTNTLNKKSHAAADLPEQKTFKTSFVYVFFRPRAQLQYRYVKAGVIIRIQRILIQNDKKISKAVQCACVEGWRTSRVTSPSKVEADALGDERRPEVEPRVALAWGEQVMRPRPPDWIADCLCQLRSER